jgi:cell filamentation protein
VSWDPYLDLESGVFRNLLGITDPSELARAEAVLTASRIYDLERSTLRGAYDMAHLQAFHRHIFGDLYDWAGELRSVSIGRGTLFCLPEHIAADGDELFAWLARTDLVRGLDRDAFVDNLTELLSDLNALHPFRDGNGRTQRAFVAQLAREAGHGVRWSAMDAAENVAASRAAQEGDIARLHAMLDKLVRRPAP